MRKERCNFIVLSIKKKGTQSALKFSWQTKYKFISTVIKKLTDKLLLSSDSVKFSILILTRDGGIYFILFFFLSKSKSDALC